MTTPSFPTTADDLRLLQDKIDALRDPGTYADRPSRVDAIQTHMAWVFLTDRYAYKLKKPVKYPFLDFSTVEARRLHCGEELRLNRRLAKDVYLGVVPLTVDPSGGFHVGDSGDTVDWLVWMRRLPGDRMLDRMIHDGTVRREDARDVGAVLADFYHRQPPIPISANEHRERLHEDLVETREDLRVHDHRVSVALIDTIADRVLALLDRHRDVFGQRAEAGRIVEGHGDLRPEHVCVTRPPVVIDCIEFNRQWRVVDAVSDLAFLGLECRRLGADWIGQVARGAYEKRTGDVAGPVIWAFYRAYHAYLRAKIALWHLNEPNVDDPRKWTSKARDYLEWADHEL